MSSMKGRGARGITDPKPPIWTSRCHFELSSVSNLSSRTMHSLPI